MNLIKARVVDNTHLELEKEIGIPEKDVLIKIIRWGVVESAEGAWGYDVNSKDFVENLRKSKRLDMNLFIDISIFVDVLRKETVKPSKLLFDSILEDNDGFTSSITVAELSASAHLSFRSDSIEKTMELLSLVSVINLNYKIAFHGGKIYSELIRRGLEIELNDCLIAATQQF